MLQETAALRKREDFAIVTVAIDKKEQLAAAYKLAKQLKMDFPVVWAKEWSPPWDNSELTYNGVPSAFIIDPQGRIMRHVNAGEGIGKQLECLLNNVKQLPSAQMKWTYDKPAKGNLRFTLQVTNPARTPLELHLSANKLIWVYGERLDGQWTQIDPIPPGKHPNANTLKEITGLEDVVRQLTFEKSDRASVVFNVPIENDAYDIDAGVRLLIPGTESYEHTTWKGNKVEGIWLSERERVTIRQPEWR